MRKPFVLNQSSWKDFMNCKRYYGWKRIVGIEPTGRRSVLDLGTAVHKALAAFHSGQANAEQATEIAVATAKELAGPTFTWADTTLEEVESVIRSVVPGYFEYWGDQGELWQPLALEIEFCVEVGEGTQNYLRGKSDNLATYKNGIVIVDYKTAGRNDPRDFLKYELDSQLSAYIYGLTKHLTEQSLARGGEPVFIRGAFIDALIKTKTPQYVREFFTRSIEELREFELEFNEYCDEIRWRMDRVDAGEDWKHVFPKNTEHCFRYGTCPFRDIDMKDTPTRRKLYVVRKEDYVDTAQAELDKQWEAQNGDGPLIS